jgi:hypothetical protein
MEKQYALRDGKLCAFIEESRAVSGTTSERGLAALEQARALRGEILRARGGEPLPDSALEIRRIRDERTDELAG